MKPTSQKNSISNLLIQICKLRRNKSNALLSEAGIHSGQDVLLYYLSVENGQTVSVLAEKMCIQQATIFNMIERMSANSLITKEKDADDKRISRVYLTEKGNTALAQVAKVWHTMEKNIVKGISAEQQEQLRKLLQQVLINLE